MSFSCFPPSVWSGIQTCKVDYRGMTWFLFLCLQEWVTAAAVTVWGVSKKNERVGRKTNIERRPNQSLGERNASVWEAGNRHKWRSQWLFRIHSPSSLLKGYYYTYFLEYSNCNSHKFMLIPFFKFKNSPERAFVLNIN